MRGETNKTEAAYKINMILCDYIELGHSRGDVYAAVRKIIDSIEPEAKEEEYASTLADGIKREVARPGPDGKMDRLRRGMPKA